MCTGKSPDRLQYSSEWKRFSDFIQGNFSNSLLSFCILTTDQRHAFWTQSCHKFVKNKRECPTFRFEEIKNSLYWTAQQNRPVITWNQRLADVIICNVYHVTDNKHTPKIVRELLDIFKCFGQGYRPCLPCLLVFQSWITWHYLRDYTSFAKCSYSFEFLSRRHCNSLSKDYT